MNVVFLLTQSRGGPADLTVSLARELSGRPSMPRVSVVGPAELAESGCPRELLVPLAVRDKTDAHGYTAVRRVLERLRPDLLHAQDRRAGLVSCLVAGSAPTLLTFHGVPDAAARRWVPSGPLHGRRPGLAGGSRLVADALVARRLRRTVAPSQAMASFLSRELRVPPSRLAVIPNGVPLPAHPARVTRVRTFTTLSSFAPCKATPLLVEAFVAIAARRGGVRLRMVGDGGDRARCEALARQAGVGGSVEFPGFRADVDAQLAQAEAFVLPSLNENMPLALLRAMAAGLPCVATTVGGVPELLAGGCGLLVPPGDVAALRTAMERLIDDPGLAAGIGAAARRRVAARFSLSRCADDHLRLWSHLLHGSQR